MSIQPTLHPIQYKHNQHPSQIHHQVITNKQEQHIHPYTQNEMSNRGDNNTSMTSTMRNRNSKLWLMEAMIEDKDNQLPNHGHQNSNNSVHEQVSGRASQNKQNSGSNINIANNTNSRKSKTNTYPDFGILEKLLKISPFQQDSSQYRHERLSNRLSADLQHQEQPEPEQSKKQQKSKQEQQQQQHEQIPQQPQPQQEQTIQHQQPSRSPEHEYYHQNSQPQHHQQQQQHKEDRKVGQQQQQQQQDSLEMVIQLDSQTSIPLKIPPHANPQRLAQQFCFTNNIDPSVITLLGKQIKQLQDSHNSSKQAYLNNNKNRNSRSYSNINSKYHSIGNSRVHNSRNNNNNNTFNNSQYSLTQMDKQNKQHLSNTNGHNQYPQQTFPQCNLQLFNPNDPVNDYTETNRYSKGQPTKYNSKNNTGTVANFSNNYYVTNTHSDVFERLYKHSETKNQKQQQIRNKEKALQSQQEFRNYISKEDNLNQSTMINNLSVSNINYQNTSHHHYVNKNGALQLKIYDKNTKLQKEAEHRHQNLKQELDIINNVECTNQPAINPLSRLIVQKLRQAGDNRYFTTADGQKESDLSNSHLRLYKYKDISKEKNLAKAIKYQKTKEENQMKQCTFHPKILNRSKAQALNTSRYVLLHEDFYIRQSKAQSVKASESKKIFERHHPQINEVSKKLVKDRSFTQRMVEYQSKAAKTKEKIEKQRQSIQKYRPEINRNSKNSKKANISIGEYLYSKSLEKRKSETTQNLKKEDLRNVNKSSEKMYQEIKKNSFRYIFTLMDSDEDGLISALKINILGLDTQVLQLLAPLLCEMEEVRIELDEEEFVDSLERLFSTFSVYEKNLILNVYKNPQRKPRAKEEPSFHPSLNERSIEIAKEVREPGSSLYEIGRERELSKQEKLAELRALKALIEFEECTFHPNLFHH